MRVREQCDLAASHAEGLDDDAGRRLGRGGRPFDVAFTEAGEGATPAAVALSWTYQERDGGIDIVIDHAAAFAPRLVARMFNSLPSTPGAGAGTSGRLHLLARPPDRRRAREALPRLVALRRGRPRRKRRPADRAPRLGESRGRRGGRPSGAAVALLGAGPAGEPAGSLPARPCAATGSAYRDLPGAGTRRDRRDARRVEGRVRVRPDRSRPASRADPLDARRRGRIDRCLSRGGAAARWRSPLRRARRPGRRRADRPVRRRPSAPGDGSQPSRLRHLHVRVNGHAQGRPRRARIAPEGVRGRAASAHADPRRPIPRPRLSGIRCRRVATSGSALLGRPRGADRRLIRPGRDRPVHRARWRDRRRPGPVATARHPRRDRQERVRPPLAADGDLWRRGASARAARTHRPHAAGPRRLQRLWPDRGVVPGDPSSLSPGSARDHRPAHCSHPALRAEPGEDAAADRGDRRDLHRRRYPRPWLSRQPGSHAGEVPRRSVRSRSRRPHVPHRRSGPVARQRRDRVSRPRRPSGQAARAPGRARRDRERPAPACRDHRRRRAARRARVGRPAPDGIRAGGSHALPRGAQGASRGPIALAHASRGGRAAVELAADPPPQDRPGRAPVDRRRAAPLRRSGPSSDRRRDAPGRDLERAAGSRADRNP